ncbi:MAG: long-chain fatty acid--CoA ligase [Porphyromonadaceae bacterium]|nr:MAG: long-chain fatty acid--CoA ligase [Porphyromonadaceae bacterium]
MEIRRAFDVLDHAMKTYPRTDALASKVDGQWVTWSTDEYVRIANQISYGLLSMGLKKGDKIVSASNNRPEWNFLDMGMMQIGVVHVPIYPTLSEEETAYIFQHSDARMAITSDSALFRKFEKNRTPNIEKIFTFDEVEGASNWKEIAELGEKNQKDWADKLPGIKASIQPEDLFTIIYTSGTTGVPKGVMLSHDNMMSNLRDALHILDLDHTERALSFLPLCHVLERIVHYGYQLQGYGLYYAENLGTIGQDLKEIKASTFVTVPRILEVMYDKIIAKGKALKGIKKQVFFWAVNLGQRYEHGGVNGPWYAFQLKIVDKLVFSKWREALGGHVKMVFSGGAALQPRLARVFTAAGILIQEGYGLTETSPVITINEKHYPDNMIGTVGLVLKSLEVKIASDGEILVKGPSVMMGYYKNEDLTREVMDADGWFRTGDIGEMVNGRFLKITDRKKEIFKNSGGKYIAPQSIENKIKESFFIENSMIIGENQKFTSAIISPNFRFLHDYCAKKSIHYRDNQELISKPQIIARYQQEIIALNKKLAPHEQVKRFRLVVDEWTSATGELSPTLKLKRKYLHDKYEALIKEVYYMSKNDDE